MMLSYSLAHKHPMATRSSLELMLEKIRQKEDEPKDAPPALPPRPVSKARLPPGRKWPINFQVVDSSTVNKEDDREVMFKSKRTRREAFVESSYQQSDDVEESVLVCIMNDERERAIQAGILGIQKCFRSHQSRCRYHALKGGIIKLQSFVRGENARKNYQLLVGRQKAVICLQSVIRDWLIRRHYNYTETMKIPSIENAKEMSSQDWKNPKNNDHVSVSYSQVADLQRRVLRLEAASRNKKEENASLQLQLQQFDRKWQQYEAKMKSLEKTWQDQFTSIQMSLAAAQRSSATESTLIQLESIDASQVHHYYNDYNTMSTGTQVQQEKSPIKFSDLPDKDRPESVNGRLHTDNRLIEQHKKGLDDDTSILIGVELGQLASGMKPEDELKKLKLRFDEWKKDYKTRLRETKATLQKLGYSSMKKSHKKWWER